MSIHIHIASRNISIRYISAREAFSICHGIIMNSIGYELPEIVNKLFEFVYSVITHETAIRYALHASKLDNIPYIELQRKLITKLSYHSNPSIPYYDYRLEDRYQPNIDFDIQSNQLHFPGFHRYIQLRSPKLNQQPNSNEKILNLFICSRCGNYQKKACNSGIYPNITTAHNDIVCTCGQDAPYFDYIDHDF